MGLLRTRRAEGAGRLAGAFLLALALAPGAAGAGASISATIVDKKGQPVEDAVLLVIAEAGAALPAKPAAVAVDQVDKEFVPRVSAVVVGTPIRFPNHDQIRHHVYSFSSAKNFEIPLYKGLPPDPIVFDQPGVVTLGCNIHDWMQGFVLVTDTPYFAKSDAEGGARLAGLPPGSYEVRVWHPSLDGTPEGTAQTVRLGAGDAPALRFEIDRKRVWQARRGGGRRGDYR